MGKFFIVVLLCLIANVKAIKLTEKNCFVDTTNIQTLCKKETKNREDLNECIKENTERAKNKNEIINERVVKFRKRIKEKLKELKEIGVDLPEPVKGYEQYYSKTEKISKYDEIKQKDINNINCSMELENYLQFLLDLNLLNNQYSTFRLLCKKDVPDITTNDLQSLNEIQKGYIGNGMVKDTTNAELFLSYYHFIRAGKDFPEYDIFLEKIKKNSLLQFAYYVNNISEKTGDGDPYYVKDYLNKFLSLKENEIGVVTSSQEFNPLIFRLIQGINRYHDSVKGKSNEIVDYKRNIPAEKIEKLKKIIENCSFCAGYQTILDHSVEN